MRVTEIASIGSLLLCAACGSAAGNDNGAGGDSGGQPPTTGSADSGNGGNNPSPPGQTGDDAGAPPLSGSDAASGGGGGDATAGGDDGGGGGGSDGASGTDGTTSGADAAGFIPAPFPGFPQLVNNGGKVLTSPEVQPVFFSNYDITAKVTAMLEGLPTAKLASGVDFWSSAVGEYGVGPLKVLPAITVAQAAPTTDTDPVAFLQSQLSTAAFKGVSSSTILAVFYPSTTPLSGSCAAGTPGYGGYHDSFSNNGTDQPYAVMTECATFGPIKNALDMVTVAGSHEIIEAATDPYPSGAGPAFTGLDNSPGGFTMGIFLQGNAENGDLCTINSGFGRGDSSYPYLLQRGWSNKAAKAGNADPCAPDTRPEQPFVGAYPVLPDTVNVSGAGSGPGVVIAAGQSKTIDVKLFSFEPTADFQVAARQPSSVNPATLTFAWDKTTGKNGDTLHLTITSVTASLNGYESFLVTATLPGATDPQKPAWAGVVTH